MNKNQEILFRAAQLLKTNPGDLVAKTEQQMERLVYNLDGNNLEALCIPCHIKTHQEMRSHTKEKVAENKARARRRFMEANDPNYQPPPDDPTT